MRGNRARSWYQPPSPIWLLEVTIDELKHIRRTLSIIFTDTIQIMLRMPHDDLHLIQLRTEAILHELDVFISELEEVVGKRQTR